jgi:cytoskeletal protein RodZ
MAGKTAAEPQQARRDRVKQEGKFEDYRKQQSKYHREWERKKREKMTKQQKHDKKSMRENVKQPAGMYVSFTLLLGFYWIYKFY